MHLVIQKRNGTKSILLIRWIYLNVNHSEMHFISCSSILWGLIWLLSVIWSHLIGRPMHKRYIYLSEA